MSRSRACVLLVECRALVSSDFFGLMEKRDTSRRAYLKFPIPSDIERRNVSDDCTTSSIYCITKIPSISRHVLGMYIVHILSHYVVCSEIVL